MKLFFTNSGIYWEWIIPDRQTVYHSDRFCPLFFYNSRLQNRIKKCLSKSAWRQNQTNDLGLCEPCNEHMFASWVWLSVSFLLCLSTLRTTQHHWLPKWACHRLSKWHTARVSLFWFASPWRWFQDGNLMTLRVKQLLKARCLHCCRWANQTGRTRHNGHSVVQIFSVVNEAHSSAFWWESAWLLEWSEQSTNQYDCSRLLLKRHTRACVQHDCCSSAKNALQRYTDMVQDNSINAL